MEHGYYQWIPYLLLLKAFIFFLPHLLWSQWEGGKMKSILNGIPKTDGKSDEDQRSDAEKKEDVAKNVAYYINSDEAGHLSYGYGYLASQVLAFLVVLFVFWFTNEFFNGHYIEFGSEWISATFDSSKPSSEVLKRLFPIITTCHFAHFGKAGDVQPHYPICAMAPNAFSEKIFIFLWFWYVFLAIVAALNLISLIGMLLKSKKVRDAYLSRALWSRQVKKCLTEKQLEKRISKLDFGQFLFLYFLGRNSHHVDIDLYSQVLENLSGGTPRGSISTLPARDEPKGSHDHGNCPTLVKGGPDHPYPTKELRDVNNDEIN